MALSDQERERILEEEWVRLQAQADFYRTNPGAAPSWGSGWRRGYGWGGRRWHPWFPVAIVAIFFAFILLGDIAERINWNHILP
jgi:hypothetical protein